MHWSGQVAIFLCLLSWVATVPLVAKLMTVRNAWTEKVNTLTVSNNEKDAEIAQLEQKRRELLDSLDVTKRAWGQVAPGVVVDPPNPGTGQTVMTNYGLNDGLGLPNQDKRPMLVHVLRPQEWEDVSDVGRRVTFHVEDAEGVAPSSVRVDELTGIVSEIDDANRKVTVDVLDKQGNKTPYVVPADAVIGYEYLGEFDVEPGPANSRITPNWLTRQADITRIGTTDPALLREFRVRERVPVAYAAPIKKMQSQLHFGDTLAEERQINLDTAQANLERSEAQLQKQKDELVGTPDEKGLQERLVEAQRARNAALARLDDLRRRIDSAYGEQQTLVTEVKDLAGELPGTAN